MQKPTRIKYSHRYISTCHVEYNEGYNRGIDEYERWMLQKLKDIEKAKNCGMTVSGRRELRKLIEEIEVNK